MTRTPETVCLQPFCIPVSFFFCLPPTGRGGRFTAFRSGLPFRRFVRPFSLLTRLQTTVSCSGTMSFRGCVKSPFFLIGAVMIPIRTPGRSFTNPQHSVFTALFFPNRPSIFRIKVSGFCSCFSVSAATACRMAISPLITGAETAVTLPDWSTNST